MRINSNRKAAVLAIKINEIDFSSRYTISDKEKLKNFYRKKMVLISPSTKI